MPSAQDTLDILDDLIQINDHWIAGYQQAANELRVAHLELKVLQKKLRNQNDEIIVDLPDELKVAGESIKRVTTNGDKIYHAWLDIKEIFTRKDRHKVLSAVEKAYKTALSTENLPSNLREMIEGQKSILKTSHDDIVASEKQKL